MFTAIIRQIAIRNDGLISKGLLKFVTKLENRIFQNRRRRLVPFLRTHYSDLKLNIYDLGAAGGIEQNFKLLSGFQGMRIIGFDPTFEKGTQQADQYSALEIYPTAISDKSEKRSLYITRSDGCSSLLNPDLNAISKYPIAPLFEVIETALIDTINLSAFIESNHLPAPDFLKLDIQGIEYEVLSSLPESLWQNLAGVTTETHLRQIYKNQKCFCDIHSLLQRNGFILIREGTSPHFSGEVLEKDVFYARDRDKVIGKTQLLKSIIFSIVSGNRDYSLFLLSHALLTNEERFNWSKLISGYSEPLLNLRTQRILLREIR